MVNRIAGSDQCPWDYMYNTINITIIVLKINKWDGKILPAANTKL